MSPTTIGRLSLFVLLVCPLAWGQERPEREREPGPGKLTLWRISGQGLSKPSYVFGAARFRDQRLKELEPKVRRAIDAADVVFVENGFDFEKERDAIVALVLLPRGQTLQGVLGPDLYARVHAILRKAKRLPRASSYDLFKPWVVANELERFEFLNDYRFGQGPSIMRRVNEAGKDVREFARLRGRLQALDSLSLEAQRQMLADLVDRIEDTLSRGEKVTEPWIQLYLQGDVDGLAALRRKELGGDRVPEGVWKTLVEERNARIAQVASKSLAGSKAKSHLFVIDAVHCGGERGLVAVLRSKGYRVERVER